MTCRRASEPVPEPSVELARSSPCDQFGVDRGAPIDRIFNETFLDQHGHLFRGRVLEIATICTCGATRAMT
jgi:hypothetical protein